MASGAKTRFGVRTHQDGPWWRVRVIGELDISTADEFSREVGRVHPAEHTTVVFDMTGVGFIDVPGLWALLDACAVLAKRGSDVAVVRGGGQADRLFEPTHADSWLPVAN
jgi:anti-anti-sigma factor